MKLLIVEDQKYPLEALEHAVIEVMPRHFKGFTKNDYDVVKSYNSAQKRIESSTYGIVLLDNRMPYEDQGDLEDRDMRKFSETLDNIGYSLISDIKRKNPNTIVIGTSSLSKEELRGTQSPDFKMRKMWGEAEEDLEKILAQLTFT